MSPKLIEVGKTYRNKGAGRTMRKVLEIGNHLKPCWHDASQLDESGVRYEQDGKEATLYLSSFAQWCGSIVEETNTDTVTATAENG